MSGIAEVLHNLGYKVQGSDLAESANVKRLRELGIPVAIGHRAENLGRRRGRRHLLRGEAGQSRSHGGRARALLPVVRRAEMLAELMRLKWSIAIGGTHGKTTTTSHGRRAARRRRARPDRRSTAASSTPTAPTRASAPATGWWSRPTRCDGTFVKLPATIAVVTNMDPEHLDHYGTVEAMKGAYEALRRRTSRSTASPCCASTIRRCRR